MIFFKKKNKLITVTVIVFLLFCYSYHSYSLNYFKPKLTPQEQSKMLNLFTETYTYCMGRYLIDLPHDFSVTNAHIFLDMKQIVIQPSYLPVFEQKIKLRQQELAQTLPRDKVDSPYLKGIHPISASGRGVIFERNLNRTAPDVARILELYAYQDGLIIETIMNARNGSSIRYNEDRKHDEYLYRNDVNEKLALLKNLVNRITIRDDKTIPTTPGLCLPNAFVADPNESQQSFTWLIKSNHYPNIKISIEMFNKLSETESMLERKDTINNILQGSVKDLRKNAFELHGQKAEELLLEDLNPEHEMKRFFVLKLNQKEANDSTPFISMTLTQTLPDDTISQAEIVELWDSIRSTLRLRPGAI